MLFAQNFTCVTHEKGPAKIHESFEEIETRKFNKACIADKRTIFFKHNIYTYEMVKKDKKDY